MTQIYCQFLAFMIAERNKDEKGATAVEYGLLVSLIAVAIIGAVYLLGDTLSGMFESVKDRIGNAPDKPTG